MTVFVLVDIIDGYVYGVFADEEKAYEWGNTYLRNTRWDIYEREVM
jgi:hypothetical protein